MIVLVCIRILSICTICSLAHEFYNHLATPYISLHLTLHTGKPSLLGWMCRPWEASRARSTLMVVIQATWDYVSKKSPHSFCINPLATSLGLYFSIVPSGLNLFLKIHLHPIGLHPFRQLVISQVPFDMRVHLTTNNIFAIFCIWRCICLWKGFGHIIHKINNKVITKRFRNMWSLIPMSRIIDVTPRVTASLIIFIKDLIKDQIPWVIWF
jgi:hypothetical protein